MIKKILRSVAQPVRRLLGIEQIVQQVDLRHKELLKELKTQIVHQFDLRHKQLLKELKTQKHQLDRASSYIEFATIDIERMRKSDKFINFHEIIPLLSPVDISGAKYRRLGRNYDGGYVMLDDFSSHNIEAAYSFGISNDVSWDEAIAELGIDVFMYDHTIDALPKQHSRFHFFKKGVTGNPPGKNFETLSNLIAHNGHQKSRI